MWQVSSPFKKCSQNHQAPVETKNKEEIPTDKQRKLKETRQNKTVVSRIGVKNEFLLKTHSAEKKVGHPQISYLEN